MSGISRHSSEGNDALDGWGSAIHPGEAIRGPSRSSTALDPSQRLKPTLLGHSAFALGMALLPHLEGLFQVSACYDGSTSTAMVMEI
jgi:hypothetical protein